MRTLVPTIALTLLIGAPTPAREGGGPTTSYLVTGGSFAGLVVHVAPESGVATPPGNPETCASGVVIEKGGKLRLEGTILGVTRLGKKAHGPLVPVGAAPSPAKWAGDLQSALFRALGRPLAGPAAGVDLEAATVALFQIAGYAAFLEAKGELPPKKAKKLLQRIEKVQERLAKAGEAVAKLAAADPPSGPKARSQVVKSGRRALAKASAKARSVVKALKKSGLLEGGAP
ncbi:MAG: hypothetical protein ACF8XB_23495 [Planctomycetota bacterium JB042]